MKNNVEVQIIVGGKAIKQHWHENNSWVEARHGKNYEIKLKNNSGQRLLAVVSVDGLSVLSGEVADSNAGGYILEGYSSYSIKGFRTSNEAVNLFEFTDKGQSYAAKSPKGEKSTTNCGIIAVRFIKEKVKEIDWQKWISTPVSPRPPYRPWPRPRPMIPNPYTTPYWDCGPYRVTCQSFGSDSLKMSSIGASDTTEWMEQERSAPVRSKSLSSSRGFDTGTKFSKESVTDKVREVTFARGDLLEEVAIYYASRGALEDFGVRLEPEPKVVMPTAFKDAGYCRPPE